MTSRHLKLNSHKDQRWNQTYIIVLSQVHPHNISQGEASLEDKQHMSFTDEVASQKFNTNVHSSDFNV